ncbi:MAG: hypothetical protein DDG60_16910 [Anaerolineae bacterium]|nr:MAG: hypothetical protein DDG60_16910 [Anaerolineae bacterium]
MNPQTMVDVVVFALAALLGMWLARRIRSPRNRWLKMGLLVLLVLAPALGADIRLVDLLATVYLNVVLQGLVFGLVAGWWARK